MSGMLDIWGAGEEVAEVVGVWALVASQWVLAGQGYAEWRRRMVAAVREMKIL